MATDKKSKEAAKHSVNNRRKAAYAALAGKQTASQKRARLKSKRKVKIVGSTPKHPIRPCGNHACRSCYERNAR